MTEQLLQANGEYLDEETSKVLNDLKNEGHDVQGIENFKKEEPKVEKTEEPKEEPKAEEKVEEEPEKEEPKEEPKFRERKEPSWKQLKTLEKELKMEQEGRKALEAKIEELSKRADSPQRDESIEELSKEINVDADVLGKIVSHIEKKYESRVKPLESTYESLKQKEESLKFEDDFSENASKFTSEQAEYLKNNKSKIKELAYSDEYVSTPLRAVISTFLLDNPVPKKAKPAESSRSSTGKPSIEMLDMDNITEEQLKDMDYDQVLKVMAYKANKEQGKI